MLINFLYDRMTEHSIKKYDSNCKFCKNNIRVSQTKPYYFKIIGLGKHDQRIICYDCLKNKFGLDINS